MGQISKFLIESYGWHEGLANAIERSGGVCEYCKEDLLGSRLGYSSIVMDHLLPKSRYPDEENNFDNHALSCSSCNLMKSNYEPVREGESPAVMLVEARQTLIERVQTHLKDKIEKRELEYRDIQAQFTKP